MTIKLADFGLGMQEHILFIKIIDLKKASLATVQLIDSFSSSQVH